MRRFAVAVRWKLGALVLGVAAVGALSPAAQAEDFFSALFGGGAPRREAPQPYIRLPFTDEAAPPPRAAPRNAVSYGGGGGGQAWCVRTCDGRYFPLGATGDQGKVAACNNFCPASKTEVVYGSSI